MSQSNLRKAPNSNKTTTISLKKRGSQSGLNTRTPNSAESKSNPAKQKGNDLRQKTTLDIRQKANNDTKKNGEKAIMVLDADGEDVTPQVLYPRYGKTITSLDQSQTEVTGLKETVSDLLNHLELLGAATFEVGGTATNIKRSVTFGASENASNHSMQNSSAIDSESSINFDSDYITDPAGKELRNESNASLPGISHQVKIREADPNKILNITLTETETMFFLSLPSICVSSDSVEETLIVKSQNAKYKELKAIIPNNDNYVSKAIQTYEPPSKHKDVQASAEKYANAECMVNKWAIHDAFTEDGDRQHTPDTERLKKLLTNRLGDLDFEGKLESETDNASSRNLGSQRISESFDSRRNSTLSQNESNSEVTDDVRNSNSVIKGQPGISGNHLKSDQQAIMANCKGILDKFSLVEKAIVSNNFDKKIISYRNEKDLRLLEEKRVADILKGNNPSHENDNSRNAFGEDELRDLEEEKGIVVPNLQLLWNYRCELTRGRHVTFISWNKQNEDILAVAYGESKFASASTSPGLILCWSAKNPEWPDRVYHTSSPVTAIDFSKMNPGLLAAGFQDGKIIIYDVRQNTGKCALDDSENNGKHRDPVWDLKWVDRERVAGDEQSRGETLVSVSTDGRVTQWIIRKGLEFTDLMVLKRLTKQKSNNGQNSNSFITRQTGGLCFDFNTKDSNIYIVGTEDGQIHKCSCSYNEQYLNTYSSHTGTVNKVKWSPFMPNVFLSCSSDWTCRLWNQDCEEEIFKFQSGKDTINDIDWSPLCSTYFGTVSASGKLEIWDLRFSVLDPIINHNMLDRQLTAISFASKSPILVTGDDYGAITVYKICKPTSKDVEATCCGLIDKPVHDPESTEAWRQEQIENLSKVLASKTMGVAAAAQS